MIGFRGVHPDRGLGYYIVMTFEWGFLNLNFFHELIKITWTPY